MKTRTKSRLLLGLLTVVATLPACAQRLPQSAQQSPRKLPQQHDKWFNTIVAHWAEYSDPQYLPFLEEARPEVAQVGFYGATFYSLAHTPFGKGYPAHMPVQGTQECGQWFANFNREIHARGVKVVGHFNTTFLFGDHAQKTGFFQWYGQGWDEKTLGPRPAQDPVEMLQKDAAGQPIATRSYNIGGWPEYHGCLNNPAWRATLKVMVKQAIERGVDGLIANYFYRKDCMCPHCQNAFRAYLTANYSPAELRERMGIEDVRTYKFTEIPSWHDPKTTNPYKLAALRWTQISLKQAYDEVLIEYGRKLKPNLIVAQWNHLGYFSQIDGDERSLLPGNLWGRGEDYLWYSTGNEHSQTDLAKGDLGDGTLQLRYIRGAFGAKSFLLGKYESTRIRASIAEGVANGGAGMGFYAPFKDPVGRKDFVDYFGFLRRNRELYRSAKPASELLLLYPRSAVHAGNTAPVQRFKELGRRLVHGGYAFDILPDDLLTFGRLNSYRAIALCDKDALPPAAKQALANFTGSRIENFTAESAEATVQRLPLKLTNVSQRESATTVVISLMAQPETKRLLVHLVNYNRTEPSPNPRSAGGGPQDEKPLAVENVRVRIQMPAGRKLKSIRLLSPDGDEKELVVKARVTKGNAMFTVPKILVYAVAVLQLK